MEQVHVQNGLCYRATFDVAHYRKTGEIIYTSPRKPCRINLAPEIMDMLQNSNVGEKRLTYMLNKEKFLHLANQMRMTDDRLAVYLGCTPDVIRALKRRYAVPKAYN